jgi:hypothetical protein
MQDPVEEQLEVALRALRQAYEDCLGELESQLGGAGGFARRRGVLAAAGTTIEHLLKILHRLEHGDLPGKPARKMTLDELVTGVRAAIPEHVQVPIRTVQGYRNLGAHDGGDMREVDAQVLGAVQTSLGVVLTWFFRVYLGGRHGEPGLPEPSRPRPGPSPLDGWRELFWWAMRAGSLKLIDRKALERRQRESGLAEAVLQAMQVNYRRDEALFDAAVLEAVAGDVLEDHEAEGLEEVRLEACISEREASLRAAPHLGRLPSLPQGCAGWMQEAWRSGLESDEVARPSGLPMPATESAPPPAPPQEPERVEPARLAGDGAAVVVLEHGVAAPPPAPREAGLRSDLLPTTGATPREAGRRREVAPKPLPFDAEAFWRALPKRTQALHQAQLALLGRSVREGLRLRPEWVSAYHPKRDKVVVLMGQLRVMTLEGPCISAALQEDALAVPGSWLRSWFWDDELAERSPARLSWNPHPRYVRPPSRNGGYDPSLDPDGREWVLIEAAHFAYLRKIAKLGPARATTTRDDPGWVAYLASLPSDLER